MGAVVNIANRRFGDGVTYWAPHGASVSPFDGEVSLDLMLAQVVAVGDNFGTYTNPTEIGDTKEMFADEVTSQALAVQYHPVSVNATLKINAELSSGDNFAIAVGFAAAEDTADVLGTGSDADVVFGGGLVTLPQFTLLHVIPNSQTPGFFDYFYVPNCQVDPSLAETIAKGTVREGDIMFQILGSSQDGTSTSMDFVGHGQAGYAYLTQTSTP